MAEQVELELLLTGGAKSVKTMAELEQALSDARKEIQGLDKDSERFAELASAIQDASSEIKTLEKQMEGLEPQQKAEAFLKMGEGIAGGFAVAQGAMGLIGVESENLEKIQVKVQSAIAIAQGVRMMSEAALMATTAKRVALEKIKLAQDKLTAIRAGVITSANLLLAKSQVAVTAATKGTAAAMKLLKGVLITTGIGALVVGVGALVNSLIKLRQRTKEQTTEQANLNRAVQDSNEEFLNNLDLQQRLEAAGSDLERELITLQDKLDKQKNKLSENSTKLTENADKLDNLSEASKKNRKIIQKNSEILNGNTNTIRNNILALTDLIKQKQLQIKEEQNIVVEEEKTEKKSSSSSSSRRERRKREAQELLKLDQELQLMKIEDADERRQKELEFLRQNEISRVSEAKNSKEQILLINEKFDLLEEQRIIEKEEREFQIKVEQNNKWNEEQLIQTEKRIAEQEAIEEKARIKQQEEDQKVADFKASLDEQGFALAKELGGKNKVVQKGIAVSETIFNTQKAVTRALADIPAPFGAIQAGIHGAMGAAAIRNILTESMGEVSTESTNVEPMTPASTGSFTLGGMQTQPLKAFVVESEISDSQAQMAEINRRSTL
tara:strand:+ start:8429 stop:10264 length:1836 start_codon:yes stop_codon:yes gene_type:complete